MEYKTEYKNNIYKFIDDGQWVTIYVNDKKWGCSDRNRFIRVLLNDIEKLKHDRR